MRKLLKTLAIGCGVLTGILLIVGIVQALTSGPNNPGTVVSDAAIGTIPWVNPGNAVSSNNSYTTAATSCVSGITRYLKATNFSFAIPADATIDGIVVEVEKGFTEPEGGTCP